MNMTALTKENAQEFKAFLTPDIADLMGRKFISGFVISDDENNSPLAGIVWEYTDGEDELKTRSRILFIKAKDEEVAGILLDEYTDIAIQTSCSDTVFELPASMGSVEKKALETAGFTLEEKESNEIAVALADVGMNLIKGTDKIDERVMPLSEVDNRELYSALAGLDMNGIRGTCEDLPYLSRDFFENEISCCLEEDGELSALALFHKKPSGKLELILCETLEDSSMSPTDILKQAIMLAEDKYEPATKILMDRRYEQLGELAKSLFPKEKGAKALEGYRKEAELTLDVIEDEEEEYPEFEELSEYELL